MLPSEICSHHRLKAYGAGGFRRFARACHPALSPRQGLSREGNQDFHSQAHNPASALFYFLVNRDIDRKNRTCPGFEPGGADRPSLPGADRPGGPHLTGKDALTE